jgi:asparagine synthase (glutamine-hydrolysing)
VAGDASIYEGIRKLPPGTLIRVRAAGRQTSHEQYWSAAQCAAQAGAQGFAGDAKAAIEELEQRLAVAIGQQMIADVPVGAFLSGGVDSSTIVALMQRQASQPVRSFTIGFEDASLNEAHHAEAVARHLGTRHTELYVAPRDALELIPALASIYSEPFADSSQIPTYLLARMTRAHVTVALSGDYADELFGGYNRYQAAANSWPRISKLPVAVRRFAARALLAIPSAFWDAHRSDQGGALETGRRSLLSEKVQKIAATLPSGDVDDLYLSLVSHWQDPGQIVIGGDEPNPLVASDIPGIDSLDSVSQMMLTDVIGYMNDDILTKVDRAAMAVSLETRVPMLDHRVAEFAWRLPLDYKLRDGQSKWILRQILYRYVPRELIERPKAGFAVPIDRWLRGPLRDWAEHLLNPQNLEHHGYLRAGPIRERWAQHLRGERNWYAQLWNVLMFQSWLENTHGR